MQWSQVSQEGHLLSPGGTNVCCACPVLVINMAQSGSCLEGAVLHMVTPSKDAEPAPVPVAPHLCHVE